MKTITIAILASLFALPCVALAELRMPAIISDHMVLQQKQTNSVWGWDTPGTVVTVSFAGQQVSAKAGDDGKWLVKLAPMPANATPQTLTVVGSGKREIQDVLVGEVWMCSGQSNMQFNLINDWNGDIESAVANFPNLRLITVPMVGTQELQTDFKGQWRSSTPQTARDFSAVGYLFGRYLQQILNVPVGLINNASGGSAAETWVRRSSLEQDPRFKLLMEDATKQETEFRSEQGRAEYERKVAEWKADCEKAKAENRPPAWPWPPPNYLTGNRRPGNLFAGVLFPTLDYGIKGVIWYQGEQNLGHAYEYATLFPFLIEQWRREWGQGDFPFYWVQLPNCGPEKRSKPQESSWAELREAQTKALQLTNTGQAVIIDLGEGKDIHPRNKHDVAARLVRWALAKDYGMKLPFRSPEFQSLAINSNKATVTIDCFGSKLRPFGVEEAKGFAVCGADKVWHWATGKIIGGNKVEVWSDAVASPLAVRYAWDDNPVCNLYSDDGLPVTPFRTDDFEMITKPKPSFQVASLDGAAGGKRFDGIGVVDGGGATSVLLKDYPEPQRSQILDLVFKPRFGASVSALYLEIPGDGNSTQGSMPSHMHTRDDLNYQRGYMWWLAQEAKKRNPNLTLDGAAWSAPGWLGRGKFWSQDTADYYVKWLQGLRSGFGLEFDAIGCRNESGVNYDFAKKLRATLNANGFEKVKIHAFDNWPSNSLNFVGDLLADEKLRDAIDIISAHTFTEFPVAPEVQALAAQMKKPIWNTEEHVYLKGFDCAIGIVKAFNQSFIRSGATKIVNWYDIAGVYPLEPFSEDPAMLLARSPWSGHYEVREALWGYAHYGQFTQVGWQYLNGGCGALAGGGSFVTLKSPGNDYSVIIETSGARKPQELRLEIGSSLSTNPLCVWFSDAKEQFIRQADIRPDRGSFAITLQPNSIYSLSTTRGQQKGSFGNIPGAKPFPFPYYETFEEYSNPKAWGYLPHYTADIAGAFEIALRPDGQGKCLQQRVPIPAISWAPDWQPYTILGDDQWHDYEVSADVYLNPGDVAGVMGRINDVGSGFGCIPKGYFMQLGDDGQCRLVVVRGKKDKKQLVGDAEQQALIQAQNENSQGGEQELGSIRIPNLKPREWHTLKLRFENSIITGLVDDKPMLTASNTLYSHGMAGLLAGQGKERTSTPYFDNLLVNAVRASAPKVSTTMSGQSANPACYLYSDDGLR